MSRTSTYEQQSGRTIPQPVMPQSDAAQYLGDIPERSLESWRYRGVGPAYIKVGRHIRYRIEDLDAWLTDHRVEPALGGGR